MAKPKLEHPNWECALQVRAKTGEEPVYVAEEDALYWIDCYGPTLNRTELKSGRTTTWKVSDRIGTYGLLANGKGAVVALGSGLYRLDFADGSQDLLHKPPYDLDNYRFNSGRCDSAGRLWVGAMRIPGSKKPIGEGAWFRLDQRGLSREIGEDVTITNGIAFSPDDRTMYIADSHTNLIEAFDFDVKAGHVGNRRVIQRLPSDWVPDGSAVDTEGGYWTTMIGAGRVCRYLPDGTLDRELQAPTSHPTMVAFGGPKLDLLYLTTASGHLNEEGLAAQPQAGAILRCNVGMRGIPEPRFRFLD